MPKRIPLHGLPTEDCLNHVVSWHGLILAKGSAVAPNAAQAGQQSGDLSPWYRQPMELHSDSQEGRDSDASEFLAMLEKSTLPADIRISVHGRFQSEDEAKELWQTALFFFKMFGTSLKLEELDAVPIADDYAGALVQVARGFDTTRP